MRCPFCRQDNDKVVDSRSGDDGAAIRRRRECIACKRRYTTYERVEENPLRVIKKDGRRVSYEREKIRRGIEKACWNLNVSVEQIDQIMANVESEAFEKFDREVPSSYLGELVMRELRKVNQVAYVLLRLGLQGIQRRQRIHGSARGVRQRTRHAAGWMGKERRRQ